MTSVTAIPLYTPPGELREKPVALRDDMIDLMRRRGRVESGHLPTIAGIAAALVALAPASRHRATGAAIDDNDETIRLSAPPEMAPRCRNAGAADAAIRLAGELLDAAGIQLASELAALRSRER